MATPQERATRAAYRVEHDLYGLENATLAQLKADLEAARRACLATLAGAPKEWQIAQAQALLGEIERQLTAWQAQAVHAIGSAYAPAAELGGQQMLDALKAGGIELPNGVSAVPMIDPSTVGVAYQTLPALIRGVGQDTIKAVGTILRQSVLAQLSPFDAMQQIGSLTGPGPYHSALIRGETILRTEVGRIAQTASETTLEGIERDHKLGLWKEWSAVVDLRTRESHARADGQRRPPDGDFSVGGYPAKYPHDPRLPARESIACRCIVVPWSPDWDTSGEKAASATPLPG